MRKPYALSIAASLASLVLLAPPAAAQLEGGDVYSLRRALGPEAYTFETFSRPTGVDTRRMANVNPAARQALIGARVQPTAPAPTPQLTSKTQNVLDYFGGGNAQQTLRRLPRRSSFIPQSQPVAPPQQSVKPFNHAAPDPTISPYHNLYREDIEESLPNYFTLVRPQQRQREENVRQQRELQRLQRQVRRTSYQTPAAGVVPATGTSARFGDTGQYYSGWR